MHLAGVVDPRNCYQIQGVRLVHLQGLGLRPHKATSQTQRERYREWGAREIGSLKRPLHSEHINGMLRLQQYPFRLVRRESLLHLIVTPIIDGSIVRDGDG